MQRSGRTSPPLKAFWSGCPPPGILSVLTFLCAPHIRLCWNSLSRWHVHLVFPLVFKLRERQKGFLLTCHLMAPSLAVLAPSGPSESLSHELINERNWGHQEVIFFLVFISTLISSLWLLYHLQNDCLRDTKDTIQVWLWTKINFEIIVDSCQVVRNNRDLVYLLCMSPPC